MEFLHVVTKSLQHFIDTALLAAKKVRQFVSKSHLKNFFLVISSGLFLTLSSCNYHLDASLEEINKTIIPSSSQKPKGPGFFLGEVVTTSNGAVVKGAFGENSEKVVLSNNAVIEGAFYE